VASWETDNFDISIGLAEKGYGVAISPSIFLLGQSDPVLGRAKYIVAPSLY
jgi:hypothetical protein